MGREEGQEGGFPAGPTPSVEAAYVCSSRTTPASQSHTAYLLTGCNDAGGALGVLPLHSAQVRVQPLLSPVLQDLPGHHLTQRAGPHCVCLHAASSPPSQGGRWEGQAGR